MSSDDDGGISDLIEAVADLLGEMPLWTWPFVLTVVLSLVFFLHH